MQKNGVLRFEISFFVLEILTFSIMQIRSVMTSYGLQLKSGKYRINDISGNIEAVLLKLGTTTVHYKRNEDTLSAVAIATISAPVSFCQKTKYPHFQSLK